MVDKQYDSNNLTYNMYSERLITQIIDSVIKERIMIDFYCGKVDFKQLLTYRINRKFGGNRSRKFYRDNAYKSFIYGANLIIPVNNNGETMSVQEYLMYLEIQKLYKEIKKYCKDNKDRLQKAIERGDSDRAYLYRKRLEPSTLMGIAEINREKTSKGFKRLVYEEIKYPTYSGILERDKFLEFINDSKNGDSMFEMFRWYRDKCFRGICIKAPVVEVLEIQDLVKLGIDRVFKDYQSVYIAKARVAMLMDMSAEECLNEVKLERGVVYEEKNSARASELIQEYLNDKIDVYNTLVEFGDMEIDDKQYNNDGLEDVIKSSILDFEIDWFQ